MKKWSFKFPNPNPKQKLFMKARTKYTAFGGARGGGKSWAVRIKAILLSLFYPGIIIMIVRETYPELRANHIDPLRKLLGNKVAKYNDSKKEYRFRNGSVILFRYCASEKDMEMYQGTEADVIFLDEATHFDEKIFQMFRACLRGVNHFPKRMYCTCNPGGKGHAWVKRLFIDRRFNEDEDPDEYSFIQSLVQDNEALMKIQPGYLKQLQALPPKLRDAWLYGRWDIFEGQFFEEFTNRPDMYDERVWTHVINPFNPPGNWQRYRSFDFGYARPFSVGWWVNSPDNVLYRVAELYGCIDSQPNEGIKWTPDDIFKEVRRVEKEHPYLKGHPIYGVADPSIWDASRGDSIADTAAKYQIYFEPGDNERLPGWMQMHYRMAFDVNGRPMLYVFKHCEAFIRTIPTLTYDKHRVEDVDTSQEDHVADEVRYMCMRSPIAPRETVKEIPPDSDPLNLYSDAKAPEPYLFFKR